MKKLLTTIIILTSLATIGQNHVTYNVDTFQSVINWRGSYSFKFSEHTGTVYFSKGELQTKGGTIIGGTFTVDMQSITNEDYERQEGAVAHLRDTDFFDVEKFPEATLVITKYEYYQNENHHKMEADLTIKGITNPIEFYPTIDVDKKQMKAQFKIDRTLWGITYNNKLKDHTISDAIEFDVILTFRQQLDE